MSALSQSFFPAMASTAQSDNGSVWIGVIVIAVYLAIGVLVAIKRWREKAQPPVFDPVMVILLLVALAAVVVFWPLFILEHWVRRWLQGPDRTASPSINPAKRTKPSRTRPLTHA